MVMDKMKADPSRRYSIKEVADIWEVSEITVRRAIDSGELPALKVGGVWRIDGSTLIELDRRANVSAAAKKQAREAKARALKSKKAAATLLKEIAKRYPELIQELIRQSPELLQSSQARRPMRRRPGAAIRQLKSSE